jgi:LysM repeat protein
VVAAIAAATVTVLAVVLGVTVGIHRFDAATHPLPPPAADLAPAGAPPPPSPLPTANPPATSTGSPPVTPTAPVAAPTLSLPDAAIAAPEPGSGPRTPAVKSNVTVTVVAGDSLMAILRRASLPASAAELRIIHQLNPLLGSGNLIHPGQRIVLPAGPAH